MLPRVVVFAGDVQGEIGRAKLVAISLVDLERTLLDAELEIGPGGEEGSQGERLEVGTRQLAFAVGLRQLLEGLQPGVADHGLPAQLHGIHGRGCRRHDLAHPRHCATRAEDGFTTGKAIERRRRRRSVLVLGTALATLGGRLPRVMREAELALGQLVQTLLLSPQDVEVVLPVCGVRFRGIDRIGRTDGRGLTLVRAVVATQESPEEGHVSIMELPHRRRNTVVSR